MLVLAAAAVEAIVAAVEAEAGIHIAITGVGDTNDRGDDTTPVAGVGVRAGVEPEIVEVVQSLS